MRRTKLCINKPYNHLFQIKINIDEARQGEVNVVHRTPLDYIFFFN